MSSLLILFCWLQKDAIIWNDSICQRGNNIIAASTMNMLFRLKSKVGGRGRALLAALDNASKNHADKSLQFPNGGGAGSPNGGGAGSPKACSEYTMLFILFSVSWVCWCHCVWNWAGSLNWPLSLCGMSPCVACLPVWHVSLCGLSPCVACLPVCHVSLFGYRWRRISKPWPQSLQQTGSLWSWVYTDQ